MGLIVQKFGGTSLKTAAGRKAALHYILSAKRAGNDVVVVVSAMGRKGDPYATDTLIELLKLHGGSVCPRKKDLIMACGEIISAAVMASYIESKGIPAEAMTGFQAGIFTSGDFGNADVIRVDPAPIMGKLKEGKVVVVAGFQGQTEKGEITTLGRGGSDTTAVVLGGYLKADLVEIYTDVPGVAVTDPCIVPEAPYISQISFKEMLALSEHGAKVIHPRAVKAAMDFNIPVRIKSTFESGEGTLLCDGESSLPVSGIALQEGLALALFRRDEEFSAEETKRIESLGQPIALQDDDRAAGLLVLEDKKTLAVNLAGMLKADIELKENLSRLTVVFNENGTVVNAGAIARRIKSMLSSIKIPVEASGNLQNQFFVAIPREFSYDAVRAAYNVFFIEGKREAV